MKRLACSSESDLVSSIMCSEIDLKGQISDIFRIASNSH